MSEKTPSQLLNEELDKKKKLIQTAANSTLKAKEELLMIHTEWKEAKTEKEKETLRTKVDALKIAYQKALDSELQVRIKAAQKGEYVPTEKERGIFHVKMEKPLYDSKTGQKASKPFIQKYTIADWASCNKFNSNLGYEVEIIWNPEIFNLIS